mgnify:CR=1 FL=1
MAPSSAFGGRALPSGPDFWARSSLRPRGGRGRGPGRRCAGISAQGGPRSALRGATVAGARGR